MDVLPGEDRGEVAAQPRLTRGVVGEGQRIIGSSSKARAKARLISGASSIVAVFGVFVIDIRVILQPGDLR
jgi:hypothetical protein